jgi:BlaI family transcriptional regulator, penicillinase repressor
MSSKPHLNLSRRERQIMEIIYRDGQATAAEVLEALPDPPSYSAVRSTLRLLEEKGHLKHKRQGRKYIFVPIVALNRARKSALHSMLHTFFGGSVEQTVASLLDIQGDDLSPDDLDRLSVLIEEARKEGR